MQNEMRDTLLELLKGADKICNDTKHCENCVGFGKGQECINYLIADHLIENGVTFKQVVYFPFPIGCENCSKAISSDRCCEEMELLYDGKHPKYTKLQDWDLMLEICPKEVTSREYREQDDRKCIGKTLWFTYEEAEQKLKGGAKE